MKKRRYASLAGCVDQVVLAYNAVLIVAVYCESTLTFDLQVVFGVNYAVDRFAA